MSGPEEAVDWEGVDLTGASPEQPRPGGLQIQLNGNEGGPITVLGDVPRAEEAQEEERRVEDVEPMDLEEGDDETDDTSEALTGLLAQAFLERLEQEVATLTEQRDTATATTDRLTTERNEKQAELDAVGKGFLNGVAAWFSTKKREHIAALKKDLTALDTKIEAVAAEGRRLINEISSKKGKIRAIESAQPEPTAAKKDLEVTPTAEFTPEESVVPEPAQALTPTPSPQPPAPEQQKVSSGWLSTHFSQGSWGRNLGLITALSTTLSGAIKEQPNPVAETAPTHSSGFSITTGMEGVRDWLSLLFPKEPEPEFSNPAPQEVIVTVWDHLQADPSSDTNGDGRVNDKEAATTNNNWLISHADDLKQIDASGQNFNQLEQDSDFWHGSQGKPGFLEKLHDWGFDKHFDSLGISLDLDNFHNTAELVDALEDAGHMDQANLVAANAVAYANPTAVAQLAAAQ